MRNYSRRIIITRNTTKGVVYESSVKPIIEGKHSKHLDLSKYSYLDYLKTKGINWKDYWSKRLIPDILFCDELNKKIYVYEVKFQRTSGSADEKLETCAYKQYEYERLWSKLGYEVYYTYILCDWFKKSKYKNVLNWVKMQKNCDYIIVNEE